MQLNQSQPLATRGNQSELYLWTLFGHLSLVLSAICTMEHKSTDSVITPYNNFWSGVITIECPLKILQQIFITKEKKKDYLNKFGRCIRKSGSVFFSYNVLYYYKFWHLNFPKQHLQDRYVGNFVYFFSMKIKNQNQFFAWL